MKDIVEIVHEAIFKVTGCKDLKADGMYLSKELEQAIEALISARETERVCKKCLKSYDAPALCPACALKATDNAFDKGFETGKAEAKIEAEAREKPMIEALEASVKAIACPHETLAGCESCCNTLAQIDAALKGEGR